MNSLGLPDLLTSGRLSRDLAQTNRDLVRVSEELSTGLKSDPVEASGGDATRLYALERDIATNDTRADIIVLTKGRTEAAQLALARTGGAVGEFGAPLAAAADRNDLATAARIGQAARSAFEDVVGAINGRFADRSLFAGASANGAALAEAEDILADIATRVTGAPDAATALAAIDDYFFTDPAGFETTGYVGSTSNAPAAEIGEGEFLDYAPRGDDPAIRQTLAALAAAAVAAEELAPTLTDAARLTMFSDAARQSIAARDAVTAREADLGVAQERIEAASVRNEAEATLLDIARNRFIARDPFEAATEFAALEAQLQSIFTITARLSSLSLTGFLR